MEHRLPLLGHRNWIVVADGAYPWQTAPGVETVATHCAFLDVLHGVLQAVDGAPHVRPVVYLDAELPFVTEEDAVGVDAFRVGLKREMVGRPVRDLPHEEIIQRLDAAGRAFHVLLLKTTLTVPYTSVFLELDCGYWNEAAEGRMRRDFADKKDER